jgi:NADH:ubiquinone oxidoreductase subunit K
MSTKNKKLIFLLILPILIIGLFGIFYYKNILEKINSTEINSDLLIRNNSWQSPFLESVPYKK